MASRKIFTQHLKKNSLKNWVGLVAGCLTALMGCTHTRTTDSSAGNKIQIVHQADRMGETEPCTCSMAPYGGLDREKRALAAFKEEGIPHLLIDTGNAVHPTDAEETAKIFNHLNDTDYDVFVPGFKELQLPQAELQRLRRASKQTWVNSNVYLKGKPAFKPYTIEKVGAYRVGIIGLTSDLSSEYYEDKKPEQVKKVYDIRNPKPILDQLVPELQKKTDFIILASQLPYADLEGLIYQKRWEIPVVVSGDPEFTANKLYELNESKTVVSENHYKGYFLTRLVLDLKLPLKGFYNPKTLAENMRNKAYFEEKLDDDNEERKKMLRPEENLEKLSKNFVLEEDPERSLASFEMIGLSKEKYGELDEQQN